MAQRAKNPRGKADDMPPIEPNASDERRTEWFNEWVGQNPMETVEAARSALQRQFGKAFSTGALAAAMRDAKEKYRADRTAAQEGVLVARRREPVAVVPAAGGEEVSLAMMVKRLGLRRVEVQDDGTVAFEYLPPPLKVIRVD